jgi:KDO2-lipid IV(A) lauroyltransferase
MTAQQIALRTALTVMYRPPRKAALKPLVEGARARTNLHLAPANLAGVRILAKTLKSGKPVGVLPDQVPQQGEGVWAPYFGRPAYTMTLPAKLAQLGRADIVLVYAERLPKGAGFVVRFVPFEGELTGSAAEQAASINKAMEQLIDRCPAQYFWSYNRYKQPEGVAAPETQALA